MSCLDALGGDSLIHRMDPRVRFLGGVALALIMAWADHPLTLGTGLLLGLILCRIADLTLPMLRPRLLLLLVLGGLLILFMPLEVVVTPAFAMTYHPDKVIPALLIALRAAGMVLLLTALLSTLEPTALGHALRHLGFPEKLILMFLFTIRYAEVFHAESRRMQAAMALRCFHPRINRPTLHTLGVLVGMLLARSLDRSERIIAAMKCRAFDGRFHLFHHFTLTRHDVAAASGIGLMCLLLIILEVQP